MTATTERSGPDVGSGVGPTSPDTPARRQPDDDDTAIRSGDRSQTRTEPRDRGTTTIADQVIAKIAAQVAGEVSAAGGQSGGFLGIGTHSDRHARPKAEVALRENSADLAIDVTMPYGQSIRETTQRVRERVSARVEELTGVTVHRVDIDVAVLVVADPHQNQEKLR